MSEIPFVQALGDAIDVAVARPRRRWRPRVIGALAAALVLGSAAAATGLFSNPTELASTDIGCYDAAGNVAVVDAHGSPVATCRRVLHTRAPLVACARDGAVQVYPHRAPSDCRPLPAGYAAARVRVAALQRRIVALEDSADCIPPNVLVGRVDALLRRSGWADWHAYVLHNSLPQGPCGYVSGFDGAGHRTIDGSLDASTHRVTVFTGPPASLQRLAMRLNRELTNLSGRRCFTAAELRTEAQRRSGRAVTFRYTRPAPGTFYGDRRQALLEQGCAIVSGADVPDGGRGLEVDIQSMARR